MVASLEETLDYNKCILSLEEKGEQDKFKYLKNTIMSCKEVYISNDQQQMITMEGNMLDSVETRLKKGDEAPPKICIDTQYILVLTGET